MADRNFHSMDHVQIKFMVFHGVGMGELAEIKRSVLNGLLRFTPIALPSREAFSRAIQELFYEYMIQNDRKSIRTMLGAIDSDEFDHNTQVRQAYLARHRTVVCRMFARAISRAQSTGDLERVYVHFLAQRLFDLMRNLSRIDDPRWMSIVEADCDSAIMKLGVEAPDDVYRAFREGPSGKHPDRRPHKSVKHKMGRPVDYASSGSGSETHPGMKKGSANPYIGGISFAGVVRDSRIRDTARPSGQAGPSETNIQEGDATESGPSGLCKPRDSDAPTGQGGASGSKDKDSKEPSG